jgi:hypothetical protein
MIKRIALLAIAAAAPVSAFAFSPRANNVVGSVKNYGAVPQRQVVK